MLLLPNTTDKISLISSAAASLDVHVSYMDHTLSTDNVEGNRQNTAIVTATTTDICAVPSAGNTRNVKTIHVRNKHASLACDVTIQYNANATLYELIKITLVAGASLEYIEGVGFFVVTNVDKLNVNLRVTADVVNSTTSAADITGLTYPVEAGKNYVIEARLIVQTAATTTGAQLSVNGPAMTNFRVTALQVVTGSATAAVMSAPVADTTTVDAIIITQTTGPTATVPMIVSGGFTPSAAGTIAMRVRSEVATSAVTVKAFGSFMTLKETDN